MPKFLIKVNKYLIKKFVQQKITKLMKKVLRTNFKKNNTFFLNKQRSQKLCEIKNHLKHTLERKVMPF